MMRLLVLTNNPSRASFRQRIGVYFDMLRTNGINCELAVLPHGSLARRKLFKLTIDFDGVFLHKKCLNFFDAFCLRRYCSKIIYDFDDAVMYSPRTPDSDRSSHFRLFRRTAKLAGMIIAGNSYMGEHAGRFNQSVKILPTGLDTKEYARKSEPGNNDRIKLVWIGSKSTLKYLAEIKPALEQIGSRFSNVILRIICDDFFDLDNMQVEKCIWSLEKQAVDLVSSDIGLAPLPDNRFTRGKCGFKILQYQAAHLPVIASPVGVNAEFVSDGMTGFLAANNNQWADRISELIENTALRKQMADAGQEHVKEFDIKVTGAKLCEIVTEFIEGP
ncbi:MAG: glycosyltransferase family 4 protein [Desulfobacterales bacterium]|nr:glycosyltransferase family 4 protein [Desulfobacterales bacterium]